MLKPSRGGKYRAIETKGFGILEGAEEEEIIVAVDAFIVRKSGDWYINQSGKEYLFINKNNRKHEE